MVHNSILAGVNNSLQMRRKEVARMPRKISGRDRSDELQILSVRITKELKSEIDELRSRDGVNSISDVFRSSMNAYLQLKRRVEGGEQILLIEKDTAQSISFEPDLNLAPTDFPYSGAVTATTSRQRAKIYTKLLTSALKEIFEENESRWHNKPPRGSRLTADELSPEDITNLIEQLNKLNGMLEVVTNSSQIPPVAKVELVAHLNKFLDGFVNVAGAGSGLLFVGTAASLLTYLGVDSNVVGDLLSRLGK